MLRTRHCGAALLLALATPAQSLVTGSALPYAPRFAGDVNGDGIDDYTGQTGGAAYVHNGASGSAFPLFTRTPGSGGYTACGDVDADGRDDLVFHASSGLVLLVSGANAATLRTWTVPAVGLSFTGAVRGADFDGDGCSDVVLIANTVLEIYSGRTGALMSWEPYSSLGTGNPPEAVVGDWNGDGHSDLAITLPVIGSVRILAGPSFTPTVLVGGLFGTNPYGVLGDVAGNGTSAIASQIVVPGQTALLDGIGGAVIGLLPQSTVRHFGDADGDGHDDFMLFSGFPLLDGLTSGRTLTRLPSTIAPLNIASPGYGDIDGDGRQDGWTNTGGQAAIARWVDPAVPQASRVARRGRSGSTTSGLRPRLHARGHCGLGSTLRLDVRGLLPNGLSVLAFGSAVDVDLAPLGAPGNRQYASLDGVSLLPTSAVGLGQATLAIPNNPALLGASVSLQAAAVEPAANALGLVTSNALDVRVDN